MTTEGNIIIASTTVLSKIAVCNLIKCLWSSYFIKPVQFQSFIHLGGAVIYFEITGQNVSNRPARRPLSPDNPRKSSNSLSQANATPRAASGTNSSNVSEQGQASGVAPNHLPSFPTFNRSDTLNDQNQARVRTDLQTQKSSNGNISVPSRSSIVGQRSGTTTSNPGPAPSHSNIVSERNGSTHGKISATNRSDDFYERNATGWSQTFCLSDLSETTLEAICRDNWVPPDANIHDAQKRSSITVEYERKCKEFALKRDVAINKAKEEYVNDIAKASSQKEAKLKVVGFETAEREKRQRTFTSFFDQLKVSGFFELFCTLFAETTSTIMRCVCSFASMLLLFSVLQPGQ
jgi:hypothetical protein